MEYTFNGSIFIIIIFVVVVIVFWGGAIVNMFVGYYFQWECKSFLFILAVVTVLWFSRSFDNLKIYN